MSASVPSNPLLALNYVKALESLGDDYYDRVTAATFPQHMLRFRNDAVLRQLGADPETVQDADVVAAFGRFQAGDGAEPTFLALRYHGYQFGQYNPFLGDGRGFLYGQVEAPDGNTYDLGTKGSGTTPYSRGGDGRLTLKGGVREVLAAEALHALGVNTSRILSLVETGEQLWRGDEPSPTRSSVMVRCHQSHIRFGTFERLEYLQRPDLIETLLHHVIDRYYPAVRPIQDTQERFARFYGELVERVAALVAQWMSVGFCHGVLNTDNMAITGESFDYGPYAFMDQYDPRFTAAYFDDMGRYAYGNQPGVCLGNLERLQRPLALVMAQGDLDAGLSAYKAAYYRHYHQRMLRKLGFTSLPPELTQDLIEETIRLFSRVTVGYHDFFRSLTHQFLPTWRTDAGAILGSSLQASDPAAAQQLEQWRQRYHHCLNQLPPEAMASVASTLGQTNPDIVLLRPEIEAVWEQITGADDWGPFNQLVRRLQQPWPALGTEAE